MRLRHDLLGIVGEEPGQDQLVELVGAAVPFEAVLEQRVLLELRLLDEQRHHLDRRSGHRDHHVAVLAGVKPARVTREVAMHAVSAQVDQPEVREEHRDALEVGREAVGDRDIEDLARLGVEQPEQRRLEAEDATDEVRHRHAHVARRPLRLPERAHRSAVGEQHLVGRLVVRVGAVEAERRAGDGDAIAGQVEQRLAQPAFEQLVAREAGDDHVRAEELVVQLGLALVAAVVERDALLAGVEGGEHRAAVRKAPAVRRQILASQPIAARGRVLDLDDRRAVQAQPAPAVGRGEALAQLDRDDVREPRVLAARRAHRPTVHIVAHLAALQSRGTLLAAPRSGVRLARYG